MRLVVGFSYINIYFVQINSSDSSMLRMFIISAEFFNSVPVSFKDYVILFFILLVWGDYIDWFFPV